MLFFFFLVVVGCSVLTPLHFREEITEGAEAEKHFRKKQQHMQKFKMRQECFKEFF
jgi:hypothetical protein